MSPALIAALFFTVALLATTAYFLFGSVPLLTLQHDTPLDSRFVRGFYNTYFLAAMVTAGGTALSYALAGKLGHAGQAAALTVFVAVLRLKVIAAMDAVRNRIASGDADAIATFRRIHVVAILATLAQLALIVWILIAVSISLK